MFKNLTLYRISNAAALTPEGLSAATFTRCGATQEQSYGWVPPRAEHGLLAETINGETIIKLAIEEKKVPAATLKEWVDDYAKQVEKATGRKPGKKQRNEIKEQALLELLPAAFTKRSDVLGWITSDGFLAINTTSAGRADLFLTALTKCADGLVVLPVQTRESPASVMGAWLNDFGGHPAWLGVDTELELKASDETRATVRYARHPLDTNEVRMHLAEGKRPVKLGVTWQGRVSFALTDTMQLRKIDFLDGVYAGRDDSDVDAFDADVTIASGELNRLIADLIVSMGSETEAEMMS